MNLNEYNERFKALQAEASEYGIHKTPQGKVVHEELQSRLQEIKSLLESDSGFILEIATKERPISDLFELIQERDALNEINKQYHFRSIAGTGLRPITEKMEALQDEYTDYFKQHLDAENAAELIPASIKLKDKLEQMLSEHQVKRRKEAELAVQVEPFMTDLNKLLAQPHITRYDRTSMQKRARGISPECMQEANKLHSMPVLA